MIGATAGAATAAAPRLPLRTVLAISLLLGVLAGLRWPPSYVASTWVVDYHFGFGKRGLVGAILHGIDRPPFQYATLAWMMFAVLAAWLALLFWLVRRLAPRDVGISAALLLFFLSVGFASLVRDTGRGEHFGLLLALPCLLMPAGWAWVAARAALLLASVLIHEANFLMLAPVLAFDLWLAAPGAASWRVLAMVLPAALLTAYLGNARTACDTVAAIGWWQQQSQDFMFHALPAQLLCFDGARNLRLAHNMLWSQIFTQRPEWLILWPALLVTLPATLFNGWLLRRVVRSRAQLASGIAASLSPTLLLIVATDLVRFLTLILATSLLALIAAVRRLGLPAGGTLPISPRSLALVAGLAAFELGSSIPLNDGAELQKFPFVPLLWHLQAVAAGREPFVIVPSD